MEVEVKEKLDHDLVLKPMVTWGSPILGPPKEARIINLSIPICPSVCLLHSLSVSPPLPFSISLSLSMSCSPCLSGVCLYLYINMHLYCI